MILLNNGVFFQSKRKSPALPVDFPQSMLDYHKKYYHHFKCSMDTWRQKASPCTQWDLLGQGNRHFHQGNKRE